MTRPVRIAALAVSLVPLAAAVATAQRGTMGVPRITTAPPTTAAPPVRPAPAPSSGRGWMMVPGYQPGYQPSGTPRPAGELPRIVTRQGYGYLRGSSLGYGWNGASTVNNRTTVSSGSAFGNGLTMGGTVGRRFDPGGSHRWRPGYTRPGVGTGCGVGCVYVRGRWGKFFNTFVVGYPYGYVPYFYPYDYYAPPPADAYETAYEPARAASKLIVVGAGAGGGGDALTIETAGDSVRLSWLPAGRPVREVKLFVTDSAQRPLATRSASPSAPTATFEIATLSAPVAFAGVTVTFTDGVMATTMVPYRGQR